MLSRRSSPFLMHLSLPRMDLWALWDVLTLNVPFASTQEVMRLPWTQLPPDTCAFSILENPACFEQRTIGSEIRKNKAKLLERTNLFINGRIRITTKLQPC